MREMRAWRGGGAWLRGRGVYGKGSWRGENDYRYAMNSTKTLHRMQIQWEARNHNNQKVVKKTRNNK